MTGTIAIVTGGLRGLGRAMTLGLLEQGHRVAAVGHIPEDADEIRGLAGANAARLLTLAADLRKPAECDRVFAETRARFDSDPAILVNNAGLTFTFVDPARFRREKPQRFWECDDEIIQAVMDTNFVAADQMARRAVPLMLKAGWGRVINVTTKLDTMNRIGSDPYGPSKAALEMATEIWAKELAGTGVTVNIVNPGAGANTPGMAAEMRARSAAAAVPLLVEPADMVGPLLFVVSRAAGDVNGFRFDANNWHADRDPKTLTRPAGFTLYPEGGWD
ncbi:MAG: SDR family oxidoreductase [Acetobacteraceae bacterium]|nr:SDR family oxidoreductase [Acetobacteraceae bacterium]